MTFSRNSLLLGLTFLLALPGCDATNPSTPVVISRVTMDIGGDVQARGAINDATQWRTGIEKPDDDRPAIEGIIELEDVALATSGDYRDFLVNDDKRKTGWLPVFLLTLTFFLVAFGGLAVGVIFGNRRLEGSCRGLANCRSEGGDPRCDGCGEPFRDMPER